MKTQTSIGSGEQIVRPAWVYKEPEYKGASVRYTPFSGKFRDAQWVEERPTSDGIKTWSVSANGGIHSLNTTDISVFENHHYVKWVRNPKPKWSLLQSFLGCFGRYHYWIPCPSTTYENENTKNS